MNVKKKNLEDNIAYSFILKIEMGFLNHINAT